MSEIKHVNTQALENLITNTGGNSIEEALTNATQVESNEQPRSVFTEAGVVPPQPVTAAAPAPAVAAPRKLVVGTSRRDLEEKRKAEEARIRELKAAKANERMAQLNAVFAFICSPEVPVSAEGKCVVNQEHATENSGNFLFINGKPYEMCKQCAEDAKTIRTSVAHGSKLTEGQRSRVKVISKEVLDEMLAEARRAEEARKAAREEQITKILAWHQMATTPEGMLQTATIEIRHMTASLKGECFDTDEDTKSNFILLIEGRKNKPPEKDDPAEKDPVDGSKCTRAVILKKWQDPELGICLVVTVVGANTAHILNHKNIRGVANLYEGGTKNRQLDLRKLRIAAFRFPFSK